MPHRLGLRAGQLTSRRSRRPFRTSLMDKLGAVARDIAGITAQILADLAEGHGPLRVDRGCRRLLQENRGDPAALLILGVMAYWEGDRQGAARSIIGSIRSD